MKIEIFRNARLWYKKAIQISPGNADAIAKLADCNKKIKSESKAIITILSIAAIVILIVVII